MTGIRFKDEGKTLMAIKALMAERGFEMSHRTIDKIVRHDRLAAAA